MRINLQKSHYELAKDFFLSRTNTQEIWSKLDEALKNTEVSFSNFITAGSNINYFEPLTEAQRALELNILFHMYAMRHGGEKIYYITPGLATRLATTNLNIDSSFLKSPFREFFVQLDAGLFTILDIDGSEHSVHGFYINFMVEEGVPVIRIMAASVLKSTLGIPFNDSLFYFKIKIGKGKLSDQLHEYIENMKIIKKDEIKKYRGTNNVDDVEEFSSFVINTLLYLTSKGAFITVQEPEDISGRLERVKSSHKLRKLQQRQSRVPAYRVLIVGANVENKKEVLELQRSGSIAKWKLEKKVRVAGHWRGQWYGSEKDDSRHTETIWIDEYEKGPEFADVLNRKVVVKNADNP